MFLSEKKLRNTFWENYNYSRRAVRWQFECPIREGNADLIENRYMEYLREHQIGAILVEEEGHWEVLYRAYYHTEIKFHQQVLKLAMKEY